MRRAQLLLQLSSSSSSQPTLSPTHMLLLAEGLGQSGTGSVASMISLKRLFPTLTASCRERGTGRRRAPQPPGHAHPTRSHPRGRGMESTGSTQDPPRAVSPLGTMLFHGRGALF